MELAKYKACICEGSAENAIMDILLDNNLLIFSREEMLEEEVMRQAPEQFSLISWKRKSLIHLKKLSSKKTNPFLTKIIKMDSISMPIQILPIPKQLPNTLAATSADPS